MIFNSEKKTFRDLKTKEILGGETKEKDNRLTPFKGIGTIE